MAHQPQRDAHFSYTIQIITMNRLKNIWVIHFFAIVLVLCASFEFHVGAAYKDWALVRVSVANVREKPGHASELGSQVIMGTPLKVIGKEGDWLRVETPEGYKGYVIGNSVRLKSDEEMADWRVSDRVAVSSFDQTYIYDRAVPSAESRADTLALHRLTDVVNGSVLELDGIAPYGFSAVRLPDGRRGYIRANEVQRLSGLHGKEVDIEAVIRFAKYLNGTPYLWGGTSSKSMDCSGLTKIAFLSQGVILPRNASQQATIGENIVISPGHAYQKGDLLFFGNPATKRVNHVGIYLGDNRFIPCAGRVMVSSLSPADKDYLELNLLAVRRLSDEDFIELSLSGHPWYN